MSTLPYRIDREFSDRFIPAIKRIVGPELMEVAPADADMHEATDLIIFRARDAMIAARMRRKEVQSQWPYDITFRKSRVSGATTEFEKIRRGWGDLFFYGHQAESLPNAISLWWLIDLHEFRYALQDSQCRKVMICEVIPNKDRETTFIRFDLRTFPIHRVKIIRASSRALPISPPPTVEIIATTIKPTFEPFGDLFPETLRGGSA